MTYDVNSTDEKVYIHTSQGCVARLCKLSAEFYEPTFVIPGCSFEKFQEEAAKRGFEVRDKHRPKWA